MVFLYFPSTVGGKWLIQNSSILKYISALGLKCDFGGETSNGNCRLGSPSPSTFQFDEGNRM